MKIIIVAAGVLIAASGTAFAQDDCTPNLVRFDVCAEARMLQAQAAGGLPMRMNQEMTLQQIAAFGRRLSMTVVWFYTNTELDKMLVAGRMSRDDLKTKMDSQTRSMVCGQENLAAFVGLGGEIQY